LFGAKGLHQETVIIKLDMFRRIMDHTVGTSAAGPQNGSYTHRCCTCENICKNKREISYAIEN
jgi:hypothetical protein